MAENLQSLISQTSHSANKQRRQKRPVRFFLNFAYFHITQQGKKADLNFPTDLLAILQRSLDPAMSLLSSMEWR